MKTKLILIAYLLSSSLTILAQKSNHEIANSIAKNILVYQVLNDFSTTVPVFFMIPGWFVFGSYEISHIPIFVDEAYYNNIDINSKKNAIHKELFDALQVDFFPEIPIDKQMEVRVLAEGRLLYRLRFIKQGDSLELTQISGDNRDEKSFLIYEGNVLGIDHLNKHGLDMQRTKIYGDTLRIQTQHQAKNNRKKKTEIHFHENRPALINHFKTKSNGTYKLVMSETYNYLGGRLASIETSDRKGNQKDSTFFVHDSEGKLILFRKHKNGEVYLSIENTYLDNGLVDQKYVSADQFNYYVKYNYKNNKNSGYTIKNLYLHQHNKFAFEVNLDNQISRIENNTMIIRTPNDFDSESVLFSYNPNGNIESIRVLDKKGQISKQIQFDYAFFGL